MVCFVISFFLLLSYFSFDSFSVRYEVMLSCWHRDPSQRPGFGELGQSLKALLSDLPPLKASRESHYINLGLEKASGHRDSTEALETERCNQHAAVGGSVSLDEEGLLLCNECLCDPH